MKKTLLLKQLFLVLGGKGIYNIDIVAVLTVTTSMSKFVRDSKNPFKHLSCIIFLFSQSPGEHKSEI